MSDRPPHPASPLVTVVIGTHNRPADAQRAISSALRQVVDDLEVVVVDDASDVPFVPESDDPRVRLVRRETGGGMCAARNDGLRIARGRWVVFLDDDDELDPHLIERALDAAERSTLPPPIAVMTGMKFVTPGGEELERCRPPTLRRGQHYLLEGGDLRSKNGLVMPTDVVRAIGGWDERLEAFEADDFGIRLNAQASILGLEDPLYVMTQHSGPRLTKRLPAMSRDMKLTQSKHRDVFRLHPERWASYMATIGVYDLRSGRWAPAIWWCVRAVVRNPRRARHWRYLGAAIAGPYALAGYRRLRPRGLSTSFATLTRRRVRKYSKRLANYPRALVGAPVARCTQAVVRRRLRAAPSAGSRSVLLCCVYRASNASLVSALLEQPLALGWVIRLWALDQVDPGLAPITVGSGSGPKFPLLNDLVGEVDLDRFDWVVVTDDDVAVARGTVADILDVAEAAGLDLVQPAHVELSHRDHAISVRRPFAVARRTTFVEIGPLFAVRRPWIDQVLPFPRQHTMGWGLELDWYDLEGRGARLGIIDAAPIRHLAPVGKGYAKDEQGEQLRALLRARGLASFGDIQRTRGTWWGWRAAPPWDRSGPEK